jgi:hypothetical protein
MKAPSLARPSAVMRSLPFDGVRHALRLMLVEGVLFALLGAFLTETSAIVWTRALPPTPVHWIAVVVGLLVGYAAVVTVVLRETVRGIVSSLEHITAELERLASHTLRDAESLLHHMDGPEADGGTPPIRAVSAGRAGVPTEAPMLLGDLLVEGAESTAESTPQRPAAVLN